jgi:metal-responsive CopG/Arc/MetJ family transcriptional regulator
MTDIATKIGRPNLSGGFETQSPSMTFRMPQVMWDEMEEMARQEGVHRNQIVRAALDAYLHGRTVAPQPLSEYAIVAKAKARRKAVVEAAQAEKGGTPSGEEAS